MKLKRLSKHSFYDNEVAVSMLQVDYREDSVTGADVYNPLVTSFRLNFSDAAVP